MRNESLRTREQGKVSEKSVMRTLDSAVKLKAARKCCGGCANARLASQVLPLTVRLRGVGAKNKMPWQED